MKYAILGLALLLGACSAAKVAKNDPMNCSAYTQSFTSPYCAKGHGYGAD